MGIVTTTSTATVSGVTVTTHTTTVTFTNFAAAKVGIVGRIKLPLDTPEIDAQPYLGLSDSRGSFGIDPVNPVYPDPEDWIQAYAQYDPSFSPSDNEVQQLLDRVNGYANLPPFDPPGDPHYIANGSVSDHIKPVNSVLISVHRDNQVADSTGFGIGFIFQDIYLLYVPNRPQHLGGNGTYVFNSGFWPDFAVDVDLPYPWGNVRLIYESGRPKLSLRTPPSGWTASPRRRHGSDSGIFQFEGRGNSIWPVDNRNEPNGNTGLTIPYTSGTLPSFYFTGTAVADIYLANGWTVTGRWQKRIGGLSSSYEDVGSPFSMTAHGVGGSGGYTQSIVVDNQSLPAPAIPSSGRYGVGLKVVINGQLVIGGPYYDFDLWPGPPRGAPHHSNGAQIIGTPFVFAYDPPSYWPFTIPLARLADDESGMVFMRHPGYLPPAATDQFALTETAPTLTRSGDDISLTFGGYIEATDPKFAGLETYDGSFRIVCADVGWEGLFRYNNLYPSDIITLPPSTSGHALTAEVVVAEALTCYSGGQRRVIKKWIVTVP